MDEELQDLLRELQASRETMRQLRKYVAPYGDGIQAPEELRQRLIAAQAAIDRIESALVDHVDSGNLHDYSKPGSSLIWSPSGKYREQSWPEFRERVLGAQGGIGVAADDFIEMLRYRPAPFRGKAETLRNAFADLTRGATELEDIELLADILSYMLRDPWRANLDGAWFIYYLEGEGTRDIDLKRAVAVINLLHGRNPYAAAVLCQTLGSYVYGPDGELVIDQLLNTGLFSVDVIDAIRGLSLPSPRKGDRHLISYPQLFISYSRDNEELMRKVRACLTAEGFKIWTDEMMDPGTPEWRHAIEQSIIESGALVVILTPEARKSTWVRREIAFSSVQGKKIFPVLADGDEATSVPIELIGMQRADIRNDFNKKMSRFAESVRHFFVSESSRSPQRGDLGSS